MGKTFNKELKQTIWRGAILRLLFLMVVVSLKDIIDPFLLDDDEMFENIALEYIKSGRSLFDFDYAESLRLSGTIQSFWHYFMCFSSALFGSAIAPRIINCLISTYIIYLVFSLTKNISSDENSALTAAKVYAYIPYMWIFCVFPFKDIFLSCAVFYIINELVKFQTFGKISITQIVIIAILSVCIYFTRGGVIEFLALMALVYVAMRFFHNKQYIYILLLAIIALGILSKMSSFIEDAAIRKIEDYNTIESISSGNLSLIQINTFGELWKLPFTYFFSILQPMLLKLSFQNNIEWYDILCISNLALYPIAIGNIIYAGYKKHNFLFWVTTFIMYSCVIALSLQTFRHYFFLFPLAIINYACIKSYNNDTINKSIKYGSLMLAFLVLIYSIK